MRRLILPLALLGAVLAAPAAGAADRPDDVKAAILYNLARFATWPDTRFPASPDVDLCVEPSEPMLENLRALDGKPIGRHRLAVHAMSWPFNAGCEMVYVSNGRASEANLAMLANHGILTVGETDGFAGAGAIRLVQVGRQVRFEINNHVAASAGVALSSQLLSLAVRVR